MNGMEGLTTPIRTVLSAQVAYALIALSLVFSLYRWNAKRVKVPAYGSEFPVLSLISAVRLLKSMKEVLADGYSKVRPSR